MRNLTIPVSGNNYFWHHIESTYRIFHFLVCNKLKIQLKPFQYFLNLHSWSLSIFFWVHGGIIFFVSSRTRLPFTSGIRADNRIQSDLEKQNFCYMGVQSWNMLPAEIRQERKLMVFKRKLRDWIKMNIAIR